MSQLKPAVGPADHAQGPLDAPVVLVEYGDYECPYCGEAYPELKEVQETLGDSICFVFRNFPLGNMHPHAERAAEFAEAAATIGRFWEMHDMLFENQQALDDRSLVDYAARVGFDADLVQAVLRGDFAERVRNDFNSGMRSGVNGTPSLFINGQRHDGPRDARSLIELFNGVIAR